MKKFLVTCGILMLGFQGFSQNYYEIRNVGTIYSEELIRSAFNNANLCGYYYADERRVIVLDDKTEIVLYAANENEGISQNCIVPVKPDNAIYKISESGIVVRILPTTGVKQEK